MGLMTVTAGETLGLFGYGSLVNRESAEQTLGREIESMRPAVIAGWRRRWSLLRDNPHCEKTFALEDGTVPDWLLTLNIERTGNPADSVNGVVVEITETDLEALAIREIRYRLAEVGDAIAETANGGRVVTYTALPNHAALAPPGGALILDTYLETVERGFRELGAGQLEQFRASTGEPPVPVVSATLIRHEAPARSPVRW